LFTVVGMKTMAMVGEDVAAMARAATGRPDAVVREWQLTDTGARIENLTTDRLERLTGTLDDGTPWSVFAKTLHPASDSPTWVEIPEEFHAAVLEDLFWLAEPRLYQSGLDRGLPSGLRMPAIHRIDEGTDRVTIWMEEVDDGAEWDLARYRRTAETLGRMSAMWPEERAVTELGLGRRPMARLFFGKITNYDLAIQAADEFWDDPHVGAVVDDRHRADLARLRDAMPAMIERVERFPHALSHGDAAPDNFLEPEPGTIVAIDWSYGCVAALGSDLGQLLAGRVESGRLAPEHLEPVADVIFEGFLAGLAGGGATVDPVAVEHAWATCLAVRSVFSALVLDHRPDLVGDERRELLRRRAALGRFGIDLVDRVLARGGRQAGTRD
jgi:hypothetical protein